MKFKIQQQELLKLLTSIKPVSDQKAELPAYLCTQLVVREDNIELNAFSMTLSMSVRATPLSIENTGVVGIATKSFYEISKVVEGDLTFTLDGEIDNRLHIKNARSEFQLNTIPGDSFPIPVNFDHITWNEYPGEMLHEFADVMFAVSKDENRPHLQGVYLGASEIGITGASKDQRYMAGCDGHRLALKPHGFDVPQDILVPADNLKKVISALDSTEPFHFAVGESEVYFSQGALFASVRMIEGAYPQFKQILPTSSYDELTVSKDELLSAIKKVTPLFDRGYTVTMTVFGDKQPEAGNVMLETRCPELGRAECFFEAQGAKEFKTSFNAHYIEQAVNTLKSDIVTLRIRDGQTPIEIREGDFIHIIMPKRVEG